ncbi:MAG: TonB-dependent receptor, partial [Thermaurantiacus sp.]
MVHYTAAVPLAALVLTAWPAMAENDDIIVTARKREETLQSVPASVSALSAAEISARGIASFDDLARATPNVSFINSGGDGVRPIIRGVSSFEGSPTVAIFLDEVPIQVRSSFRGSGGAADIRFLDIERVEVLRGPQGTLFGGNALGGAIRYVTRTPSLTETDVRLNAELGTTRNGDPSFVLGAVAGTPLVDGRLAVRIGAQTERTGGWIDRVDPATGAVVEENVDRFNFYAGRAALLFQATDRLAINMSWFGQKKEVKALSYSNSAIGIGRFDNIRPETVDETFHLLAIKAEQELGAATLFAQVSWFTRDFERAEDYSAVLTDFGLPADWAPYTNGGEQTQDVVTAELRASGDIGSRLVWTVGGFFYRSNLFSQQTIAGDNAPGLLFRSQNDANDRQWAIFAEASWQFLPAATITVGARNSWLRVNTIRDSQG